MKGNLIITGAVERSRITWLPNGELIPRTGEHALAVTLNRLEDGDVTLAITQALAVEARESQLSKMLTEKQFLLLNRIIVPGRLYAKYFTK